MVAMHYVKICPVVLVLPVDHGPTAHVLDSIAYLVNQYGIQVPVYQLWLERCGMAVLVWGCVSS